MPSLKNRKFLLPVAALACLAILLFIFPLFHVVSLKDRQAEETRNAFDPEGFVESFWNKELLPAAEEAIPLQVLMAALESNPDAAREQYAHQVGLGNTHHYFIKGEGKVVEKDTFALQLSVDSPGQTNVLIQAGPVFGNTIRDGSGLLDVNDYPNSRVFNQISAELNKQVEELLEQLWQDVKAGDTLSFAGCIEITNPERDHYPLKVVPVIADVK